MRRFFRKPVRLCCALILLISSAAIAQDRATTSGYSPRGESLLALVQWRIAGRDGHLRCEVLQEAANLHTRVLTIYKEEGNNLLKIFSFSNARFHPQRISARRLQREAVYNLGWRKCVSFPRFCVC